jgi:hypothetical protein
MVKSLSVSTVMFASALAIAATPTTSAKAQSTSAVVPVATGAAAEKVQLQGAPGSTTTAVQLDTVKPASARKVTMSYTAENAGSAADMNYNKAGALTSIQTVGVGYKLSDTRTIRYRQPMLYNMTDGDVTNEWTLGDHRFTAKESKLFKINDTDVSGSVDLILPRTQFALETGKIEMRYDMSAATSFEGLAVSFDTSSRAYGYTKNEDAQRIVRQISALGVSYDKKPIFAPMVNFTHDIGLFNGGEGRRLGSSEKSNVRNEAETLTVDVGFGSELAKGVSMSLYTSNEVGLRGKSAEDLKMFQEDTTSYALDLSVSL